MKFLQCDVTINKIKLLASVIDVNVAAYFVFTGFFFLFFSLILSFASPTPDTRSRAAPLVPDVSPGGRQPPDSGDL
jgi:hypothetical protein